jgi:hypothetical protein
MIADSVLDFSGHQGEKNWFYGYYNRTLDTNMVYETTDFIPFPSANAPHGPENYFNGTGWVWPGNPPPWTQILPNMVNLCALNSLGSNTQNDPTSSPAEIAEHWVVRRWKSPATGPMKVSMSLKKNDTRGGDGVTGFIYHNGVLLFTQGIRQADTTGFFESFEIPMVKQGDLLDFIVSPVGPGQTVANDAYDSTFISIRIVPAKTLEGEFVTDISKLMRGKNSSIYYRLPFVF